MQLAGPLRHALFQVGNQLDRLDGDRGAVRERLQQLHFLARGPMRPGPVNADCADGCQGPDRHHDEAFHECRPVGFGRNAGVLEYVLDHCRLPIQHRPAADTGGEREAAALPQRPDGIFLGVKAVFAIPQDERRTVGAHQVAGGVPDDVHDGLQVARQRKALHHRHELLHAPDVGGGFELFLLRRRCRVQRMPYGGGELLELGLRNGSGRLHRGRCVVASRRA